ncbi:hypothetical protein AB1N83_011041 [Pleurotus pulmonarius]
MPPDNLTNIHVVNFAPNLTAHVQPDDQGIIRCFKSHYRAQFTQRAIDRYNAQILPANIYVIDQLEGMRIAQAAWNDLDASTIQNCWKKASILPDSLLHGAEPAPPVPVTSLLNNNMSPLSNVFEARLQESLDELQARGALQGSNKMSIKELLNPAGEQLLVEELSDQDIFDAVISQREDDKHDAIEIGGKDDDEPIIVKQSRKDVLNAVSILQAYIADLNNPIFRSLECSLALIGRETCYEAACAMKLTNILDHFARIK